MCSVDDENCLFEKRDTDKTLSSDFSVCRSCENPAEVVLRKKDAYCRVCFFNSCTHKFRATLGKSKIIKAAERVLFIFSGNHSSMALAHMLHSGLNEEKNKRLIFNVDMLYIDDGLVMNESFETRMKIARKVTDVAESFKFRLYLTTLSEVFNNVPKVGQTLVLNDSKEEQLKALFQGVKSMTAKEDLLYQLRHKLIAKVAHELSYSKVFSDEVGSDLAVKLLVGISLGRGDQISAGVNFCDNRYSDVPELRPLVEFTHKEIVFYNVFHRLKPVKVTSLTTMSSPNVSISKTTEKFISELQEEFPSTVYTIFRTGSKLKANEMATSGDRNCALCNRIIRQNSTEIGELTGDCAKETIMSNDCNQNGGECRCSKGQKLQPDDNADHYFCYGCSLIFKDMENKDAFQKFLREDATREKNLQELKEQISEFLIDF